MESEIDRLRLQVPTAAGLVDSDAPTWAQGVEEMEAFFDTMAPIWDEFSRERMKLSSESPFYRAVAAELPQSQESFRLLVLGCGTGLELPAILARAPNVRIDAQDLAPQMLMALEHKFSFLGDRLQTRCGSYVEMDFAERSYDCAVSTLTLHHLPPGTKSKVYSKIYRALRHGGLYIEGDHSYSDELERSSQEDFKKHIANLPGAMAGEWNYNQPLSVKTQAYLLRKAGFTGIRVTYESPRRPRGDCEIVMRAEKQVDKRLERTPFKRIALATSSPASLSRDAGKKT